MGNIIKLDEMQRIENQILKYFKEVCENNNLRYYLAYGTLLGAVRHSGFIPWDDDIDVMMPRPDYLKLVDVLNKERHEYYDFISMHNNKKYFAPLAKIYDIRTVLIQDYGHVEKTPLGVCIDVFILDGLPDDIKESNKLFERASKLRFQWGLSVRRLNAKSKTMARAIVKTVISIPFKLLGFRYFLKKIDSLAASYNYATSQYVGVLCFGEGSKERIKKPKMECPTKLLFEGNEYNVPENYHSYLTNMYGDYMKLPPENQRVMKHRYRVYWK